MGFRPTGTFEVPPLPQGWGVPLATPAPSVSTTKQPWQDDTDKKKAFGIELAKIPNDPFKAACIIFTDTSAALWATQNWVVDPIVMASKDLYLQAVEEKTNLLDKLAFAAKLLKKVEEKSADGRFYLYEGKDQIALLKLYAEVQGFIGKQDISATFNNNNTTNEMKIIFVEPDHQEEKKLNQVSKIIENNEEENLELLNDGIKLKLVG